MEKSELRVLIKNYFLREKSIKGTEEKLAKYYKESAPSHGMVHKWFTEFRCGRINTSDAERLGCPKKVTSQEMIDKIHDIVLNDRRLNIIIRQNQKISRKFGLGLANLRRKKRRRLHQLVRSWPQFFGTHMV